MIPDINQIAAKIHSDMALMNGRVLAAEGELAKLELAIDQKRDEKARVIAECDQACLEAHAMKAVHEQAARQAHDELAKVKAHVATHESAIRKLQEDHKSEVSRLKGDYRATLENLKGEVAHLQAKRDGLKADIAAVLNKYRV